MPDRFEQKREELVKKGVPYAEAQAAKLPYEPNKDPKQKKAK